MSQLQAGEKPDQPGKNEKTKKDLLQAHELLMLLQDVKPADIQPAWENLIARGPRWKKYAKSGFRQMERNYGEIKKAFLDIS